MHITGQWPVDVKRSHSPFVRTPMNTVPPSYDDGPPLVDLNSDPDPNLIVSDLPAYTPSQQPTREPKEFHYELKRDGKLLAVLTMISDAAYSKQMPTFFGGTPLKGKVHLTLDKPDAILSVAVSVSALFSWSR